MSAAVRARAAWKGPPPSPFHVLDGVTARHRLPDPRLFSPLTQLLTERKTIRIFDQANPITVQELSTLLYYTYGAQGIAATEQGHASLRKTSPSGGGMHPVEAYPLIITVRGQPSGLYHYSVARHELELMQPMTVHEAQRYAEVFALGQSYFRSANAMFILTARWYRSFWKYPRSHKAYRVVHLDAGHLSQTLYLLCSQLGLGAFFTGAVNDINIEEVLGLDPLQEGVIGISGCGRPLNGGHPLTWQTQPYTPSRE
jgi:putative peptide maturation dehydrogenase